MNTTTAGYTTNMTVLRLRPRLAGRPGRDAPNAAIAPSRATARKREMTDRSTQASAAACAWVTSPASILTHKSYFCSALSSLFGLRSGELISRGLLN